MSWEVERTIVEKYEKAYTENGKVEEEKYRPPQNKEDGNIK